MNKTLREQLRPLSRWISNLPPSPNNWGEEGVDHINIDRLSKTHLGQTLSMDSVMAWEHPVLGRFTSLKNLWYFLKAKNRMDSLRTLHPRDLRITIERKGGHHNKIKNFMQIVLWGTYYRVKYIGALNRELQKTTLPFDSYRASESGVRSRNNTAHWLIEGYEEIRRALLEDREPDFNRIAPLEGPLEDLHKEIVESILNQPKVSAPTEQAKPRKPKKMGRRRVEKPSEEDSDTVIAESRLEDVKVGVVESIPLEDVARELVVELNSTEAEQSSVETPSEEPGSQTEPASGQEATDFVRLDFISPINASEVTPVVASVLEAGEASEQESSSEETLTAGDSEQTEQPSVDNNV